MENSYPYAFAFAQKNEVFRTSIKDIKGLIREVDFVPETLNIHTKESGNFVFTTKDNKKTLRALNNYIDSNKLRRSLSFFEVIKRSIKNLIKK